MSRKVVIKMVEVVINNSKKCEIFKERERQISRKRWGDQIKRGRGKWKGREYAQIKRERERITENRPESR